MLTSTRLGQHAGGERGSIPLAMLAMIVTAGLVTVVAASTMAGERSVRFDEDFSGALPVAEAGIQEVAHQINSGQLTPEDDPAAGSGTIDGYQYDWTADTDFEPGDAGPVEWTITSTGHHDEVTRTLTVTMSDEPLFNLGAFSDLMLGFSGGNIADSYNSDTGEWCTGNGRVGSDEDLDFGGSAQTGPCADEYPRSDQTVDGVDLYDWDANPDPARCTHSGGSNCYENNDSDQTWYLQTHDDPVQSSGDVDWMKQALGVAADDDGADGYTCERTNSQGHMTISGTLEPADSTNGVEVEFLTEHGAGPGEVYAYCADEVTFEGVTELANADAETPVVFIVGERVTFQSPGGSSSDRAVNIGCDAVDCSNSFDPKSVTPVAAALQIYTPAPSDPADSSADVIRAQNRWKIAAAVYAPRGSCGGITSNPQIDLFGSLVCSDIRNQGGWQFHYDDALGGAVRTGEFVVNQWGEN